MNDKHKLMEENINLVYFTIHKYYPSFIKDEDIIQCGMLGLCCAAKHYDPTKSKFSTFAISWIKNEIKHELQERGKRQVEISLETFLEGNRDEN